MASSYRGNTNKKRPIVLAFSDYYLPGFKSGGGMRTLVNIVDRFGDDYDFRIVTRDHDGKTDTTTYPNIVRDRWTRVGKASVRYLSKDRIRLKEVNRLVKEVSPDCIYLNSYFSTLTVFSLLLRRLGKLGSTPFIIAPQGELANAGLALKKGRKKLAFIKLASRLGLYNNVVWRATSDIEYEEISAAKGSGGWIFVAADLPQKEIFPNYDPARRSRKESGAVSFVFLSRIHPKKNLTFLLELLRDLRGKIRLDVIGPVDADSEYIRRCDDVIATLPVNVTVDFHGGVEHTQALDSLLDHHFFVLPTITENFGHVFLEAMSAGCPLIISDRTPWRTLEEKGVGWDIPLEDPSKWKRVLGKCIAMGNAEYERISGQARQFAQNWVAAESVEEANRAVFEYALSLCDSFDMPTSRKLS